MIATSEMNTLDASASLPAPVRTDRWQPLRSGLLNLYRYDCEEFRFEQGRLLLRGDNGTGKSRVLALQLPFLLDGEVSPARFEPDGDVAKRIEWNLLMGRWSDRTGYTWLEFGLRSEDGSDRFLTIGCGMRAVAGQTGLHSRWFFITRQRIGRDLILQSSERRPLSRDRLQDAIGESGRVFVNAEEYRRAVDDALFGLGERYGRLVDLLIRLRRPQLSRKLDEAELSQALSDALPTLPGSLVDDVAESFRSLQADRETVRGFAETQAAVDDFLREYGHYARVAVRRRAGAIRTAHADYEDAGRRVRDAERRLAEAESTVARLVEKRAGLDRELAAAEEAVRTLQASPEMQTAQELAHSRTAAEQAEQSHRAASADAVRAENAAAQSRARLRQAEKEAAGLAAALEKRLGVADACALACELSGIHRAQVPAPPVASWLEPLDWVTHAPDVLDRAIRQRRDAIAHLRRLEAEVTQAGMILHRAEEERRRAADACTAARDAEADARRELDDAAAALIAHYREWQRSARELRIPDVETCLDAFSAWLEQREGLNPLRGAAESVHREAIARLAEGRERARQEMAVEEEALAALRAEIETLERGQAPPPGAPPTRRADRAARPGAPLWRVCDFAPDTPEPVKAGLEGALEASGLLDAWVLPDGRLLDPSTEDTFLLDDAAAADGDPAAHLGTQLVPAIDPADVAARAISPELIRRLLRRIGRGRDHGAHWVADDGSWRLGPLAGRWSKTGAEHIGESTRAAARRRRLAELRAQCEAREAACARLRATCDAWAARMAGADAELAAAPGDQPVRQAGFRLTEAARAIAEAFVCHEKAEREAAARRRELEIAENKRDADGDDLGLRHWLGRLDDLERAISDFTSALASLWPTVHHWESLASQLHLAREQTAEAERESRERTSRQQDAAETAAAAHSRFEILRQTHGETIAAVLERLAAADGRVVELKHSLEANQSEHLAQTSAKVSAESDRTHAAEARTRHEQARQVAITAMQLIAEQRLLGDAHAELAGIDTGGWAPTRAVEIARQIEALLAATDADDDAWRQRQDAIHAYIQELRDRLIAHGHRPETHQVEELVLVRCVFQARPHTMTELRDAFAAEVSERERLLAAREKEIIENHLLGEIAVELQRLIRSAEEWIASANRELSARPTSTGLRFRFAWEPENGSAFANVRRAFLRTSELWSPAERAEITRFLQERIRAEQAANEDAAWRDHLGAALDYRRWHRFMVERQQDGQWRRLDRRTYGTGSGGEKALALTLPRFAAAAAHYRSARPDAPRLIMLDEAFAGIDPHMRAQCMGVLAQFDIDVAMTSEQEWGCYATVPGLAIHHLTTFPGIDAVATTLWIWNGQERRRVTLVPSRAVPRPFAVPEREGQPLLPLDELAPPGGAPGAVQSDHDFQASGPDSNRDD